MISSVASRSREAVSRSLADQLAPVLRLHAELRQSLPVAVDVARARARIANGRHAFDPAAVLRGAAELGPLFARALTAFELAGMASSQEVCAVRRRQHDATALALAWVAGDRLPSDPAKRLARRAAALLGSAVLRNAAAQVLAVAPTDGWERASCPCCGGMPDLAFVVRGQRRIVCSRCDTSWRAASGGCLACGAEYEPTLVRIRSPYLGYTLVMCNACGHYLKERGAGAQCEPLLERELTAQLDAAARDRGLGV